MEAQLRGAGHVTAATLPANAAGCRDDGKAREVRKQPSRFDPIPAMRMSPDYPSGPPIR